MSVTYNALAHMHLVTARSMPRKVHPVLYGEPAVKYAKQAKRERKVIAEYYRFIRRGEYAGHGPEHARIAHRYGVVVSASEARSRIKNMKA